MPETIKRREVCDVPSEINHFNLIYFPVKNYKSAGTRQILINLLFTRVRLKNGHVFVFTEPLKFSTVFTEFPMHLNVHAYTLIQSKSDISLINLPNDIFIELLAQVIVYL